MWSYTASNARTSASQFFVKRATTSSVVVDKCFFIMSTLHGFRRSRAVFPES